MESEPIRDRASLLTSARLRPWRSSRPLSAVEDETVMEAVPDSKSGERVTAGGRVLRLPHVDGEAARWQPPA